MRCFHAVPASLGWASLLLLLGLGCAPVEADHPLDPHTPTDKQHKGRLAGQVVFVDGGSDAKLEATRVRLFADEATASASYEERVDSQGRFLFDAVDPGQYRLSVSVEGYVSDDRVLVLGRLQEVDVGRILMRVADQLLLAPVSGSARLDGADDHAGTMVTATDSGRAAVTADDGRFVLDLPIGDHSLTVTHEGYASQTVEVSVPNGGAELDAQVLLAPLAGSISGAVSLRRFADAARLDSVAVTLQPSEGDAQTGGAAFDFQDLPPGDYALTARAEGYDSWTDSVTLGPGEAASVDAQLTHASAGADAVSLGGTITLTDGGDPGGTRVEVSFERWDLPFTSAVADADGVFATAAAADEPYALRFARDGYDVVLLAPVTWDPEDERFEDDDGDPVAAMLRP